MAEKHYHVAACWDRYEPCGEHHRHSYNCGGGKLRKICPGYASAQKHIADMASYEVLALLRAHDPDTRKAILERVKERLARLERR